MLVASIFPFSHNVFEGFFLRAVKCKDCEVKSYRTFYLNICILVDKMDFMNS